jgi:hypothetical protein
MENEMKKIIKTISVIAMVFTFSASVIGTAYAGSNPNPGPNDHRDVGHKKGDRGE